MSFPDAPAEPTIVATPEDAVGLRRRPLLVLSALERHLDGIGLGTGPVRAERIGGGYSNVTFLVQRDGGLRLVLRRPPRPPFHESAHDVLREARMLRALGATAARVPRVIDVCADPAVLGVPFYLMEELAGTVITTHVPESLDDPAGRAAVASEFVDALVELHAVPVDGPALAALDRGPGFVDRQLARWGAVWREHRTRDVPGIEDVEAWLHRHRPPEPARRTVVHGDYRLGNVVFAGGAPARLRGILDWEIGTIGDPLVDLGCVLTSWPEPGDDVGTLLSMAGAVAGGGFPTRDELIDLYATRSGRRVDDLGWYLVFAFWRTAVGLETLYARRVQFGGGPNDHFLTGLAAGVPELAMRARVAAAEHSRLA